MSRTAKSKSPVIRVIDANYNRLKEGLRVCEEVARFVLDHRGITCAFKGIRHELDSLSQRLGRHGEIISSRDSLKDVGRELHCSAELKRRDCRDVFLANIQRVKESLRVLEEFSKLVDTRSSARFKENRYRIYELEKKVIKKLQALCNHR